STRGGYERNSFPRTPRWSSLLSNTREPSAQNSHIGRAKERSSASRAAPRRYGKPSGRFKEQTPRSQECGFRTGRGNAPHRSASGCGGPGNSTKSDTQGGKTSFPISTATASL